MWFRPALGNPLLMHLSLQVHARPCSCALAESQCRDAAPGHRGGPGRITNTPKIRSSGGNGRRRRISVD
jgi:hypothetical protein